MPSNPTDAAEVERAPVAPSAAQPPSPARRGAGQGGQEMTGGPALRGAGPLVITVIGRPAPQGSKRLLAHGAMVESSKRVKPWREDVKQAALDAIEARAWHRLDGPVAVEVLFCFDPPKSAPKKRRIWPTTRSSGDIDKLARAALDSLTAAGAFHDDSQVVWLLARKVHTNHDDVPLTIPGAVIAITEVNP